MTSAEQTYREPKIIFYFYELELLFSRFYLFRSHCIFGATVSGLFLQLHPFCYKYNRKLINICAVTVDNNVYNFNS